MRDRGLDRLFRRFRRHGDVEALGALFDSAASELLRIARHLVGNAAEAEDLVQSTFVTAIEHASEFDAERRLMPWLLGILAHHAANARRKRESSRTVELAEDAALVRDASKLAEERELRARLREIVAELPAALRQVVESHLIEGKRPQEIALELGLSAGATRVRLHRGLERVRRALPVGFAAGAAAVSVTSSRGLAAVRSEVLASAKSASPALSASAASTTAASIWLGGWLVSQRIVITAVVLVAVVGSYLWWQARPRPSKAAGVDLLASAQPVAANVPAAAVPTVPRADDVAVARREADAETGVLFQGVVLDDLTGKPIAAARVFTTPVGASERVARAASNDDGTFEFRAQAAEEASLLVEADGYAALRLPLSKERLAAFALEAKREELDGGANVRLFELRLQPGVELAGRVVRASDHTGLEGAELVLLWQTFDELATLSERVVGHTRQDGRMEFDGLLPAMAAKSEGNYVLFAIHDQGLGWTRIARPAGRARLEGIEIVVDPPFELTLRVLDEKRRPVPDVHVTCVPVHDPFARAQSLIVGDFFPAAPALMSCFRANSDANGVARFPRLLRSQRQAQFTYACEFFVRARTDSGAAYRDVLKLDCEKPAQREIVLASEPRTVIRGRVLDAQGVGIAGAEVVMSWPQRQTTSAANGSYELAKKRDDPITVNLEARKPGLVSARRAIERAALGGELENQDFVLREPLSIEGRVVDQQGAPIAGIHVHASDGNQQWASTQDTPSAADGSFRIDNVTEGEWELYPAPPNGQDFVLDAQHANARGGERGVEIVLKRRDPTRCALELDVVDAATGAVLDPVYAVLLVEKGSNNRSAVPRLAPGKITCDELSPGRYTVFVAVAGRANGAVDVEVSADVAVTHGRVEIALPARVRGRVDLSRVSTARSISVRARLATVSGGIPIAPAFERGSLFSMPHVDARNGAFEFDNLTPGRWQFDLLGLGVRSAKPVFELRSGETADVVIVAEPAGVIEFNATASPRRGWVIFENTDANGVWSESTSSWSTESASLPPMKLTVDPGHVRWRAWFLAEPNMYDKKLVAQTREGELDIAAGQSVSVTLEVVLTE